MIKAENLLANTKNKNRNSAGVLGSVIGKDEGVENFVKHKTDNFTKLIQKRSYFGKSLTHAAYQRPCPNDQLSCPKRHKSPAPHDNRQSPKFRNNIPPSARDKTSNIYLEDYHWKPKFMRLNKCKSSKAFPKQRDEIL